MCLNYRPQSRSRIHPGSSENWILRHEKATFEMTVSLISTGDKESKVFTSSLQELRRRNCQRMIKVNSDKQLSSFRSWRVRLLGFQQQQWRFCTTTRLKWPCEFASRNFGTPSFSENQIQRSQLQYQVDSYITSIKLIRKKKLYHLTEQKGRSHTWYHSTQTWSKMVRPELKPELTAVTQ